MENPNRIYITRDETDQAQVVLRFRDRGRVAQLDMTREIAAAIIKLLQDAIDRRVYADNVDPEGDALDAEYFGQTPEQRRKAAGL